MKGTTGYLVTALVLAALGAIALIAGRVDRRLVDADREFAARQYTRAEASLDAADRYIGWADWMPWVAAGPARSIEMRRIALQYWSGQYDRLIAEHGEPTAGIGSADSDLQLVAANAVYRRGSRSAKGQPAVLDALQMAATAYLAVLKSGSPSRTAAYNYEYVVRTREDIEKGRRAPELTDTAEDGPAGRPGGPPPETSKKDLKLLVPLDPGEMDKGVEPGKGSNIERKG